MKQMTVLKTIRGSSLNEVLPLHTIYRLSQSHETVTLTRPFLYMYSMNFKIQR
jgi:hypothetical protein